MSKRYKTDKELLEGCFAEDRGAMEEFTRNYSKLIYYSIHRVFKLRGLTPRTEDVEDIFGDIFVSLFESNFARLKSFEGRNGCTLASWIRLIAGRRCIDYLRERARDRVSLSPEDQHSIEDHPGEENPEEQLLGKERTELFLELMPNLNPDELLFLSLYYDRELPPEEIGEILGVSTGTVYSKKHRIQEKLRRFIKE